MPHQAPPGCHGCGPAVAAQPTRATMVNGKIDPGDMLTYCTVSPCGEITPCCLIDPRCSPCYPNCGRPLPKDKCNFEQEFRMIMNANKQNDKCQNDKCQDSICCCIPKPCLDTCPCCVDSPVCKVYRYSNCKCLAFCEPGSGCTPKPCCKPDPCCKPKLCCEFDPCCKPKPCCKPDPCCKPKPCCKPDPCCKPKPCCKPDPCCKPEPCCKSTPSCKSKPCANAGICHEFKACSNREPFYNSNFACSQSPTSHSDIYDQYKSHQEISTICEKYKFPQKPDIPRDDISGLLGKYQSSKTPNSPKYQSAKSPKQKSSIPDIKDPTISRCDLLIRSIDEKLTKNSYTDMKQSTECPCKNSMNTRTLKNNTMTDTDGPALIDTCGGLLKRLDAILANKPNRNNIEQIKESVCINTPKTQNRSGLCNSGSKQSCKNDCKSSCKPKDSTTSCSSIGSCTYCPCSFSEQNTVNDKFYINYLHNNTFQRSKTNL